MKALTSLELKKTKKVILLCGVILTALVIAIPILSFLREFREPQYKGHSVSYWIRNCIVDAKNGNSGFGMNRESEAAIESIGKRSVPYLQEALKSHYGFFRPDSLFSKYYENIWKSLPKGLQSSFVHPRKNEAQCKATIYLIMRLAPEDLQLLVPDLIHVLGSFRGLDDHHTLIQYVIDALKSAAKGSPKEEIALQAIRKFRDRFPIGSPEFQWVDVFLGKGKL